MSVWMFPGQGAQKPGMGADLLHLPEVRETFAEGSEALGIDLVNLATTGTEQQINDAFNAQVLACVLSVGLSRELAAEGIKPQAVLGFSLGQISGLIAARALSCSDGLKLLRVRAESMAQACAERPGAMVALLGASHEQAQKVCDACADEDVLVCANYNAPGQVVLSGDVAAIERAEAHWREAGKRFARLNTAGAFHSPLMAPAAEAVRGACARVTWHEPCVPLICNTDAQPFTVAEAAERLSAQVVSPVRFEQSVQVLIAQGQTAFVEVGFGGVLTGLVRRIDKAVARQRVGTFKEFEEYRVGHLGLNADKGE